MTDRQQTETPPASGNRRQRGSAMIAALWASIALAVLVAAMGYSARTDITLVRASAIEGKLEEALSGGLLLAADALPEARDALGPEQRSFKKQFSIGEVQVTANYSDEAGRIDLNSAPEPLLAFLFQAAGASPALADQLAGKLLDWRDGDDARRLNGAELGDYSRAGLDYGPANAPLHSLREFRALPGMPPEIFEKLKPHVTLHSQLRGLDADMANPALLQFIGNPGRTAAGSPQYHPDAARYLMRSRRQVHRIELTARLDGNSRTVTWIIRKQASGLKLIRL